MYVGNPYPVLSSSVFGLTPGVTTPCKMTGVTFGGTNPCKMTGVTLQGVVSRDDQFGETGLFFAPKVTNLSKVDEFAPKLASLSHGP